MRCPSCGDEYEPGYVRCAGCGVPLIDPDATEDADIDLVPAGIPPDARLGRFHPAVAERVVNLLERRGIGFTVLPSDDESEIRVDTEWRDDVRAELTMSWNEVVRGLEEPTASEVLALGGSAPGWFDAPRGGYVDRTGRMVVEVEDDDDDADAARVIGPVLLTSGALAIVVGWMVVSLPILVVAGIGLVIVGLLLPR